MKKRVSHNLRFKQGDLMVVAPRGGIFMKETWAAGPRIVGMSTPQLCKIKPGTAYLALSDAAESSHRYNRKLYVEVMVENKLVPVWANHFKMKKITL